MTQKWQKQRSLLKNLQAQRKNNNSLKPRSNVGRGFLLPSRYGKLASMDVLTILLLSFLLPFFITAVATPALIQIARLFNLYDAPSARKVHTKPIARLGGIGLFLGVIAAIGFFYPVSDQFVGIILGGLVIAGVGLWDDLFGVTPVLKLGGQIAAAFIVYSSGISIAHVTNPFGGLLFLDAFSLPLTLLWIVGITNTINLIDGLDGLAAGIAAISAAVLSFVALQTGQIHAVILTVALFGSCLAFLIYNFSPAKIFMGDTGSTFLGYILATASILGVLKSTVTLSLAVPILAMGVPISDMVFAIVRRLKNKQAIFQADDGHVHHRLLRLGLSHRQTVMVIYSVSAAFGAVAILSSVYVAGWLKMP